LFTIFFNNYAKIYGAKYLFAVLGEFAQKTELKNKSSKKDKSKKDKQELDSDSASESIEMMSQIYARNNSKLNIQIQTQQVIHLLLNHDKKLPNQFHGVFQAMQKQLKNEGKSEKEIHEKLAYLYFSCFICDALSNPEQWGLVPDTPSPATRQILLLIGQLVAGMATNEQLNDDLNDMFDAFIVDNKPVIEEYLTQILSLSSKDENVAVPPLVVERSKNILFDYINNNYDEIATVVKKNKDISAESKELFRKLFEEDNKSNSEESVKSRGATMDNAEDNKWDDEEERDSSASSSDEATSQV